MTCIIATQNKIKATGLLKKHRVKIIDFFEGQNFNRIFVLRLFNKYYIYGADDFLAQRIRNYLTNVCPI